MDLNHEHTTRTKQLSLLDVQEATELAADDGTDPRQFYPRRR